MDLGARRSRAGPGSGRVRPESTLAWDAKPLPMKLKRQPDDFVVEELPLVTPGNR